MHLHTSALDFVALFLMYLLASAIVKTIAMAWPDHPIGKAFALLA